MRLTGALETGHRKIANNAQNEAAELMIRCKLMKGLVKILTGFQLEGQSLHSIPKKAATE